MKFPPEIQNSLKKLKFPKFAHQELVFWILGIILFIVTFMQLLILPVRHGADKLAAEISEMKLRTQELSGGGSSLGEVLVSLRQELSATEGNLAQKEKASEVLSVFLGKANALGITVFSVRPEPPFLYPNAANPLRLEGKPCQALLIQMGLQCSYRTLGKYLETLEKEAHLIYTVDGLELQKGEGSSLAVKLYVTTYLFGNP